MVSAPKTKKTPDPAVVAANNRRKIEKDQRRKHYHDLQVQGTNNSSIVSKRSVEKIYNPVMDPEGKEWFKFFVPSAKRRSPAINRGYWLRMESIKQMVMRILAQHEGKPVRVVNLGCGFDPLPFQLLSTEKNTRFAFYDFDYPELVQRKLRMIESAPEILDVIGKCTDVADQAHLGVVLATDSYTLVGCNLNDAQKYENQVSSLLAGDDVTIFIAEVSLAYMKHDKANAVIEILSRLPNAHMVVLEQIMPAGPDHFFAQKMLYHFSHLRSPLQCVEAYPTLEKQKQRFLSYFGHVDAVDLFQSWEQLVPREKKHLLATVEDFAEHEEFVVFCKHYVLVHASTRESGVVSGATAAVDLPSTPPIAMQKVDLENPVEVKFAAACETTSGIYVHGGMLQARSDNLQVLGALTLEDVEQTQNSGEKPAARMCHSLVSLAGGDFVLIGGRTRPGMPVNDVWRYKIAEKAWSKVLDLEGFDLSRVQATRLQNSNENVENVLIYGAGQFALLSIDGNKHSVERLDTDIPPIHGCGLGIDETGNSGVLVGGLSNLEEHTYNQHLFRFEVNVDAKTARVVEQKPVPDYVARSGCAVKVSGRKMYVIGGAGPVLSGQNTTIVALDLETGEFGPVSLSDEMWRSAPVLIGSSVAGSTVVGGGAVCYSFGSAYSLIYRLDV